MGSGLPRSTWTSELPVETENGLRYRIPRSPLATTQVEAARASRMVWTPLRVSECPASLRLHHCEQITDMKVTVEFGFLFVTEFAGFGPIREVLHPFAIPFAEVDREQIRRDLGRDFATLCFQ